VAQKRRVQIINAGKQREMRGGVSASFVLGAVLREKVRRKGPKAADDDESIAPMCEGSGSRKKVRGFEDDDDDALSSITSKAIN